MKTTDSGNTAQSCFVCCCFVFVKRKQQTVQSQVRLVRSLGQWHEATVSQQEGENPRVPRENSTKKMWLAGNWDDYKTERERERQRERDHCSKCSKSKTKLKT